MSSKLFLIGIALAAASCGSGSKDIQFGTNNGGSGGSVEVSDPASGSGTSSNLDDPSSDSGKIWTVSEILSEPRHGGGGGVASCGGELGFARCVCPENVPSSVRYRPAVEECNGHAAAIFHDRYLNIFSVVLRDTQNRDRWPEAGSGYGGCSFELASSENAPNYCSAFKSQDRFFAGNGTAEVHCFGEAGYSSIMSDASRLTLKLGDDPNSSNDPVERFCLFGPDQPLN